MNGQRETLIPSKLKYITLIFHKTNNNKLNINNRIQYLYL